MKASDGLLPQEFADLCGVSKDTLLYYDKIGLFSPELVAENGYRVYSLDQVHTFDLLLLLRDSRLPLKQMKTYLENRNTEEMLSLLRKQSRALKEQIGQLQTLCQRLDFTAQQMERGAQCALDQPAIQQRCEEQYMVVSVASHAARPPGQDDGSAEVSAPVPWQGPAGGLSALRCHLEGASAGAVL